MLATAQPPRLMDRVRGAIRARHYSRRTEDSYAGWIRRFILFHGKKHPAAMGAEEVNAFLTNLAVARRVLPRLRRPRLRLSFVIFPPETSRLTSACSRRTPHSGPPEYVTIWRAGCAAEAADR
jgi:hypothetical protein